MTARRITYLEAVLCLYRTSFVPLWTKLLRWNTVKTFVFCLWVNNWPLEYGGATTQVSELLWEPSLNCKKKSLFWRNAVILGSQHFFRGVWIAVSELLQVSELPVSITKTKTYFPKVIIWPTRSFWDQNKMSQFSVEKSVGIALVTLIRWIARLPPLHEYICLSKICDSKPHGPQWSLEVERTSTTLS